MINYRNLHAADGSFLGFLYQIERAIFWLSITANDGIVGLEVDDDIVVKLNSGLGINTIYEQAKHSKSSKIPYTDKGVDLWKTLSIWVEAVLREDINLDSCYFSLLTNKKLPETRLAKKLSNASLKNRDDIEALCGELKTIASTLKKAQRTFGDIVLSCPDEILMGLIDRIVVMDNGYTHNNNEMKKAIKNNLSISDGVPFDHIYNALFGYVTSTMINAWRQGEKGWLSVNSFNHQYNQLIAEFTKKSFVEKTIDLLPVHPNDIKLNQNKNYVEQLRLIDCSDDEVLKAIHDYVRAASERSRFAKDGELSEQKFKLYFEDLIDNWESLSKPIFKFANKPKDFVKIGYEVYYGTIKYKGKLNNYEPEQGYTHRGSYHHLADTELVGWHPEWNKKNTTT